MATSGVAYFKRRAAGVPLHVVQIDIRRADVNLAVVTASGGIGRLQSWSTLIERSRPAAAITGTYFDTLSAIPIGSIGVNGQLVHHGLVGTAFSYSPAFGPRIAFAKPFHGYEFKDAQMFLRAGPRLISQGRTTLYPRDEGFRDPSVFSRAKRTAVAISAQGKLLLVATAKPVLLRELAAALKGLGATDAMGLDGGSSTGLYHRGKSWLVPQRRLTNLLVVYDSMERYTERLPFLNV